MNRAILILAVILLAGCDTSDGIGEPAACPIDQSNLVLCSVKQADEAGCPEGPETCFALGESTCCSISCDGGVCK